MSFEINLKKGRLKPASWIQPHPGGSSILCSKCRNPDFSVHSLSGMLRCNNCQLERFAVHVDRIGKDSGAVREIVCTGCLTQTQLDMRGAIGDQVVAGVQCAKCGGRTRLEPGAVIDRRGEFINHQSKRIINDDKPGKV